MLGGHLQRNAEAWRDLDSLKKLFSLDNTSNNPALIVDLLIFLASPYTYVFIVFAILPYLKAYKLVFYDLQSKTKTTIYETK